MQPDPPGQFLWATSATPLAIARLGGDRPALRKLSLYLRLPAFAARDKEEALSVVLCCNFPDERERASLVVPVLIRCSRDPNPKVRAKAAGWLGEWPEHAGRAVPALEAAAHDADKNVREAAAGALARIRGEK
jgi:hypothetical protein